MQNANCEMVCFLCLTNALTQKKGMTHTKHTTNRIKCYCGEARVYVWCTTEICLVRFFYFVFRFPIYGRRQRTINWSTTFLLCIHYSNVHMLCWMLTFYRRRTFTTLINWLNFDFWYARKFDNRIENGSIYSTKSKWFSSGQNNSIFSPYRIFFFANTIA